jgi:hypothetical protein
MAAYVVGVILNCDSEEQIATAMTKLQLPLVGLMLDGISFTIARMESDET